jgi:hypothetical protein
MEEEDEEEDDGERVFLADGVLWTLAIATAMVVTVVAPKLGILLFLGEAIFALLTGAAWMLRGGRPRYVEASTGSLHRDTEPSRLRGATPGHHPLWTLTRNSAPVAREIVASVSRRPARGR